MKFKGDLLLTDPVYIIRKERGEDWGRLLSDGFDHAAMHYLGITDYVSGEIGEDSVRIVTDGSGNKIGSFCSDSALFCVCDLNQVLAYNPDFLTAYEKYPDCFCVIRDFDGEIGIVTDETGSSHVTGSGKNGFGTRLR